MLVSVDTQPEFFVICQASFPLTQCHTPHMEVLFMPGGDII